MRAGGVRVLGLELWQPLCDSEYGATRVAAKPAWGPDLTGLLTRPCWDRQPLCPSCRWTVTPVISHFVVAGPLFAPSHTLKDTGPPKNAMGEGTASLLHLSPYFRHLEVALA